MLKILEKLYQELEAKDVKGQCVVLDSVEEFVNLYQDGLSLKEIREHLTKGCNCPQVKSKEELGRIEKKRELEIRLGEEEVKAIEEAEGCGG